MNKVDRIKGAFLGSVLGDAIGVPFEFQSAHNINPEQKFLVDSPLINLKPYHQVPRGVWSDDTSMTMALFDALLTHGIAPNNWVTTFRKSCLAWRDSGKWTSHGVCFDIGGQTSKALREWKVDQPIPPYDDGAQGNGALMRMVPVLLASTKEDLLMLSDWNTMQTHHDHVGIACSRMMAMLMWGLIEGQSFETARLNARITFDEYIDSHPAIPMVDHIMDNIDVPYFNGDGWCVETLGVAVDICKHSKTVLDAIAETVVIGGDTDTNAAVVGAIKGVQTGITQDMLVELEKIHNNQMIKDMLARIA